MNHLQRIFILLKKEFTEFYTSKAWILVLVLPVFIAFLFTSVYREAEHAQYTIAYVTKLPPPVRAMIDAAHIHLRFYANLDKAQKALTQNKVDAVLTNRSEKYNRFTLQVTPTGYQKAVALTNALNAAVIKIYAHPDIPQFELDKTESRNHLSWLALPLWLIQIVLTICFLQNTAAVAEEKERHTLHALLVSPLTLPEYLFSKLGWATFLGTGSLWLTLGLTHAPARLGLILIFGLLGSTVYAGLAILLGLAAPNPLLARTISTVLYLLSSLPLIMNNMGSAWRGLFDFFPSFLIWRGFETALSLAKMTPALFVSGLTLFGEAVAILGITALLFHRNIDI